MDCIKGGVMSGTLKLSGDKGRLVFGRGEDVDVEITGELVSRVHGVLDFMGKTGGVSEDGFPFFLDNQSSHGTVLNKRMRGTSEGRVPPLQHVKLFSGDILSFGCVPDADAKQDKLIGERERVYVIRNIETDRFDRQLSAMVYRPRTVLKLGQQPSAAKAPNQQLLQQQNAGNKEVEESGGGVSWGFREDAVDDDEEEGGGGGGDERHGHAPSSTSSRSTDDDDNEGHQQDLPDYLKKSRFGGASSFALGGGDPSSDSPFKHDELPSSLQGTHSTYLKKLLKLRNLKVEAERIEAKADSSDSGTLSSGQEARLQKLLSQISESDDEAKALEADIRHALGRAGDGKKGGGESGRRAKQPGEDGDRGEEDDDFFDRTRTATGKGKGGGCCD